MEAGCIIADINQRNFLNQRDIRKSRQHAFETHDKPRMKSLPAGHFTVCDYKYSLRVLDNYHLEYDGHYYSVMYTKHGKPVLLKAAMSEISICDENNRLLCTHVRSYKDFLRYITEDAHMPPEHRYYKELNAHDGAYYRRWATVYGDATLASVRGHLIHLPSKPEESRRKSGQIRRKQDGLFHTFILFSTAFHLVPDFPVPQIVKIKFIENLFIEKTAHFVQVSLHFVKLLNTLSGRHRSLTPNRLSELAHILLVIFSKGLETPPRGFSLISPLVPGACDAGFTP